ncbi:MAG: hypothetical protein M1825_006220 [Sarcosagium campestre]|nr:MAG: hypothetical protein M1825_006220 [Sarcosagium campestre]
MTQDKERQSALQREVIATTEIRPQKRSKVCFVTIGATASFNELVSAVLDPSFLLALHNAEYTDLLVQHGHEGVEIYSDFLALHGSTLHDVQVTGFDFDKGGLTRQMCLARGAVEVDSKEGLVISHAGEIYSLLSIVPDESSKSKGKKGSGSILAALRIGAPLVVVPNPSLLDNHQVQLAKALAGQGYVVHGRLDDLPRALLESERLRKTHKEWPPVNSGEDPSGRGLAGVMDDEMGFLD